MVNGLVIVDAWQKLVPHNVIDYPDLENELRSFGTFLNQVCNIERKKGTQIIHWGEGGGHWGGIMDEIEVAAQDKVIGREGNATWEEIQESIDDLYWCGFHFGRCIHREAAFISGQDANIVLNLSLLFPQDSWKESFESMYWGRPSSKMHYYLWSQTGFEEVSIQ